MTGQRGMSCLPTPERGQHVSWNYMRCKGTGGNFHYVFEYNKDGHYSIALFDAIIARLNPPSFKLSSPTSKGYFGTFTGQV
jgi:hypothetical protein